MLLRSRYAADLALVLTTLIWGSTFIIAKDVLATWTPLGYLTMRFAIAGVAFALLFPKTLRAARRAELKAGVVLGAIIGGGFLLQAAGQVFTTVAKSAFITSLTTPLVPLCAFLILRARPSIENLVGVIVASIGGVMMLAPMNSDGAVAANDFNTGDLLTLACTVLFATHITLIDKYAHRFDARRLAVLQVITAGLLFTLVWSVLRLLGTVFDENLWSASDVPAFIRREAQPLIWNASIILQLLYLALIGTLAAFLLWTWGQARMSATHAAIIFSLEPIFATLFAVAVRGAGEWTGGWMTIGALLILSGVLLSELRWSRIRKLNVEKVEAAPDA